MKTIFFFLLFFTTTICLGQDNQTDFSKINEHSSQLKHLLSLFTIHGVPKNQNIDDTLSILINHGYAVGYSKKFNQPLWVTYQVSKSKKEVDYERFPYFLDDPRLKDENRIGTQTFGNGFDLGHLAPNAAINKQYGKLSQMESFLMSNISPQSSGLNRGIWQKLEADILNKYPYAGDRNNPKHHVWVIVGPVFSEDPQFILRPNGTQIAIPSSFYCILIRPRRYPFDAPGNSDYLAFLFPQELAQNQRIDVQFLTSINEIERLTNLNILPNLTQLMENRIEDQIALELW